MARASTFTSYINVEPDRAIDAKFSALERKANQTFSNISRSAAAANARMAAGMGGSTIGGATTNAMRAQAASLRETARENQRLSQASAATTRQLAQQGQAAATARREVSSLERTLRTTATTLNVVQGPLGPIAGRVGALASAVRELTGLRLGLAGVGAGLFAITSQANKYTEVRSRLVPLYESQQDLNRAMRDTVRIAESARTSLAPVVDLYAKLTLAGRDVGLTQRQTSKLTEIAAKAAKLSGGAQISQDAGLYQFAQGVGSGSLGGDELKSIRENTIRLAKAIADGLGVPMAELKKLGKEGKLTPKVIADALEKESDRIDRELARLPETLSSASAKFQNALMTMVGEKDQSLGFTTALAEGLAFVAKNIQGVTNALLMGATAFAVYRAGAAIGSIQQRAVETRNLQIATVNAARAEVAAASDSRKAAASRIVGLRSVRAELQQQIAAERQVRAAALATARDAQQNARRSGPGFLNVGESRRYSAALGEARTATNNLANAQARLGMVTTQLSQQTATMTGATSRFRTAQAAAGAGAVSFGSRLRGLIGVINPLGIALSVGISLLIGWAFRQTQAAKAADYMAEREASLGRFIDANTGKIIEQNKALLANERIKARDRASDALNDYRSARSSVERDADKLPFFARGVREQLPEEGRNVLARYRARKITASEASAELEKLAAQRAARPINRGADTRDRKAYDRAIGDLSDVTTLAREQQAAAAYDRLIQGKPRKGDVALAQGIGYVDPTGKDMPGGTGGADAGGVGKATKGREKLAGASDAAAKAEAELQRTLDRTDKRDDILSRYDSEPKAIDRAKKDIRELSQLVGQTMNGLAEITDKNPLGKGIYTEQMAQADAARINYGVRQPIRDLLRDQQRQYDIGQLILGGYEDEAAALEKALSLQDTVGDLTREEFEQLVANERQQRKINDALESRGRITSLILNQAQEARDAFEDLLMGGSIKDFGKTIFDNIKRIEVRKITERLFAGTDEKLRELVKGQGGVEQAVSVLQKNTTRAATGTEKLAVATERAAARIDAATQGLTGQGIGGVPTTAVGQAQAIATKTAQAGKTLATTASKVAGAMSAVGAGASLFRSIKTGGGAANDDENFDPNAEIVVTGSRSRPRQQDKNGPLPTGAQTYDTIFEGFGDALDGVFKTDGFFKKIGGSVGQAFQGAGTGMMASSFAKALGIKQSTTGAAIGGAIGSFLPIPGGSIIGGLVGGTIGGLFKKTKSGSATIGADSFGGLSVAGTSGNSASYKKNAEGLAGGVIEQLNGIAQSLGADLSGNMGVSIGQRKKSFVVDTTGRGKTKGAGTVKFDSEEEAIAYAVKNAIQDGVLGGISAASQRILAAGKNMQAALEKAMLIESIPKRLMQLTNPVKFAVTELNAEFSRMISALKEGGATAQQFADAQKLYDLERARAIEAATQQAAGAIQAFLDEMMGGQSSPLNKRTVYQNAAAKLDSFKSDINSGKAVDQEDLLTAAKNFQDASRNLFGSGADFFSDFTSLKDLLTRAKENVMGSGANTDIPGSPFASDSAVQSAIASLSGATNNQTNILNSTLQQILAALNGANDNGSGSGSGYGGSSLGYLPGLYGGGGGGGRNYNQLV